MRSKAEFLKEIADTFKQKNVQKWYCDNLYGNPQSETLDCLEVAIHTHQLSVHEALVICLIVGIQWDVKFPGVP